MWITVLRYGCVVCNSTTMYGTERSRKAEPAISWLVNQLDQTSGFRRTNSAYSYRSIIFTPLIHVLFLDADILSWLKSVNVNQSCMVSGDGLVFHFHAVAQIVGTEGQNIPSAPAIGPFATDRLQCNQPSSSQGNVTCVPLAICPKGWAVAMSSGEGNAPQKHGANSPWVISWRGYWSNGTILEVVGHFLRNFW